MLMKYGSMAKHPYKKLEKRYPQGLPFLLPCDQCGALFPCEGDKTTYFFHFFFELFSNVFLGGASREEYGLIIEDNF